MRTILLLIILIVHCFFVLANKNIDSLKNDAKTRGEKPETFILLSNLYASVNPDSSLFYAELALKLSIETGNLRLVSEARGLIGDVYYDQGAFEGALNQFEKSLKINQQLNIDTNIALNLNYIGMVYEGKAEYKKALEFYNKALEINKRIDHLPELANNYNNIGMIYFNWGSYKEAIEHYRKAIVIDSSLNRLNKLAVDYNNLGLSYWYKGEHERSLSYFRKALDLDKEIGNKTAIAPFLNNIGLVYYSLEIYDSALFYFQAAIDLSKELGNFRDEMTYKINLGVINALKLGNFQRGYELYAECEKLCIENGYKDLLLDVYMAYYKTYKKQSDFGKALEYYELYSDVKDSVFNEDSQKALEEYRAKFQTEKREQEIEILKKDQQIQQFVIYAVSAGFLFILALGFIALRAYRMKKKSFDIIKVQKEEILEKNEELNQQNEEISAQRDEIGRHKNILENQNKQITDSIRYARRIQKAVLRTEEYINKSLLEHFILFLPRDIVSGDFYWAASINGNMVIAAVDCTGHGVPGAFMSMLGIAFLNEIVNKDQTQDVHEILNRLREYVINSLNQTGREDEAKDGMDISLCIIDENSKELHYAGANNPLWILEGDVITEISADKMPIGICSHGDKPFTRNIIPLKSGSIIYLFSDGLQDQFGGEKCRKLGKRNVQKKLISMKDERIETQKELLEAYFFEWKGNHQQVDDVLFIGIKIK